MTLSGTIQNGQVLLDHPADLPDVTRVTLQSDFAEYEYPHSMAPYDREKEIALLRESIQQMKDGKTRPFDEVMAELINGCKASVTVDQDSLQEDFSTLIR